MSNALVFQLLQPDDLLHDTSGAVWHGPQLAPPCYAAFSPGQQQGVPPPVRALEVILLLELQRVASSPAGASLCLLPRVDAAMYSTDTDTGGKAVMITEELLAILPSLDWEPPVPLPMPAEAIGAPDDAAADADAAAGAASCARRWPSYAHALRTLLSAPGARDAWWARWLPQRHTFVALAAACDAAAAETLTARYERLHDTRAAWNECKLLVQIQACDRDLHILFEPCFGAATLLQHDHLLGPQTAISTRAGGGRATLPSISGAAMSGATRDAAARMVMLFEPPGKEALAPHIGIVLSDGDHIRRVDFPGHERLCAGLWLLRTRADGSVQLACLTDSPVPLVSAARDALLDVAAAQNGEPSILVHVRHSDVLAASALHSHFPHPVHAIVRRSTVEQLRGYTKRPPALLASPPLTPCRLTLNIGLDTSPELDAGVCAALAAKIGRDDMVARAVTGVHSASGLALVHTGQAAPADGRAVTASMPAPAECIGDVISRLDWAWLVPPR
jgi:hypothetical protein